MPFFKSRFDKRNIKKEQKSKYSIKKHTFLPKFKYFCCFSHKSEVKVKKKFCTNFLREINYVKSIGYKNHRSTG